MQTVRSQTREVEAGVILRTVAVISLLGAAAVHFSLLGDGGVPAAHATTFAIIAWVQVGLALWMLRPSRNAAAAVVAVQAVLIAGWTAAHVFDVWVGAEDSLGSWARVDTIAVVVEGLALLAGVGLLVPGLARRRFSTEVGYAGVGVVAATVALLSGLLFSPAADDASSASAAGASPVAGAKSLAPGSDSHDAEHGSETASGGDHADHDAKKAAELAFLFPDGNTKGWENVENGVEHAHAPDVPENEIPAATRAELRRQLALTMQPIAKYPTVADAEKAGYRRAGPFTPGLGAHYVGGGAYIGDAPMTDEQIVKPSTLVYAGTDPDSPIVGFMYVALSKYPEGFAGPNDHWHTHSGICLRGSTLGDGAIDALGADGSITEADCTAQNGRWMAVTQGLLHVWTVPGYADPLGVFAHTSPAVTCPDGTYYNDGKDPLTTCRE